MIKKFKLNLPDNIGVKDSQWKFLKEIDGKVVKLVDNDPQWFIKNERVEITQLHYNYPIFKVSIDWLTEIKKPMTAKDYYPENYVPGCGNIFRMSHIQEAFRAGEANERLRHKPTQTFEEWWEPQRENQPPNKEYYTKKGWDACCEAHRWRKE